MCVRKESIFLKFPANFQPIHPEFKPKVTKPMTDLSIHAPIVAFYAALSERIDENSMPSMEKMINDVTSLLTSLNMGRVSSDVDPAISDLFAAVLQHGRSWKTTQIVYRDITHLGEFASNKFRAMHKRLAGKIEVAQRLESEAERFYNMLPAQLRW